MDLGGRRVLDGVHLAITEGAFVGLVGPNGAGKTTLLRSVLGVVRPTSGRVVVGSVSTPDPGIAFVPQRHSFAWDYPISVERAVLTGRTSRASWWRRSDVDDWSAVVEALEEVDLIDLAARPVGELSGGQQQRVLVARALARRPNVLLLDEPFAGLDLPSQDDVEQVLLRLAAEGVTVFMATHDLVGAVRSCEQVVLLNQRVIASGTPAELSDPSLWARAFGTSADHPRWRSVVGN
ncbi:MAG: anchored repeat-type ABC transporter ATP-binding subunit [Actinobacteria bacterium]|nr:anchored repeat-type ABC transporter ATP-binding subunit [Actinomycetota bacterium]